MSRYRTFPTIFQAGGPSPTVRQRCRRATEHFHRSASIFLVRSSRLGGGLASASRGAGAGSFSVTPVFAMPMARTSSRSRVLSDRRVAQEVWPWACASMPVRSDSLQVHTDDLCFFPSPLGNGGTVRGGPMEWPVPASSVQLHPIWRLYISGLCPTGMFLHGSSA